MTIDTFEQLRKLLLVTREIIAKRLSILALFVAFGEILAKVSTKNPRITARKTMTSSKKYSLKLLLTPIGWRSSDIKKAATR